MGNRSFKTIISGVIIFLLTIVAFVFIHMINGRSSQNAKSGNPSDNSNIKKSQQSNEKEVEKHAQEEDVQEEDVQKTDVQKAVSVGALHVAGAHLVGEDGNQVQLKGISTHGLAWFPQYVNEDCFRQLHEEMGINVIRLAMYTSENGGYCNDGDQVGLRELVKKGVEYATENNMYVIIDWHILSDNNPNMHLAEAERFFAEMASEYADYTNVIYEICNEPNGNTTWDDIKAYAYQIIDVIRNYDKDSIIIVGTPNWSQYVDKAVNNPITGYENIMYALHFYAATHTDALRSAMTSAVDSGLPIFVTEYGICDASGNGRIDEEQANKWVRLMDSYGISYVAWNLSNKDESSAILNSNCTKTYGFTQEDLSESGRWLLNMLKRK